MVLLVSFTLASYLIGGSNDFFAANRPEGTTEVTIPEDVTIDELTQIVYKAGAIDKPEFFKLFCMITVDDDELEYFQPGTYQLETNMDYQNIISTLQAATRPARCTGHLPRGHHGPGSRCPSGGKRGLLCGGLPGGHQLQRL